MKKIFTLTLILIVLSTAAFSQRVVASVSFRTNNVFASFNHRYIETYSLNKYERDMRIAQINAMYDQQVKEVMYLRIGASKKIDLIQQLQRERNNKIQNVNTRFFDNRNKYNYNHYDRYFNWTR